MRARRSSAWRRRFRWARSSSHERRALPSCRPSACSVTIVATGSSSATPSASARARSGKRWDDGSPPSSARSAIIRINGSTSSTSGATLRATEPLTIVAAGVVTPVGADLESFWSALLTGSDGITAIERFRVDDLRVGRGGEIKKLRHAPGIRVPECRASQLLVAAADDLLAHAVVDCAPERLGVVVGTALGGVDELEQALAHDRSARRAEASL